MPLYIYQCTECSHRQSVLHKYGDDREVVCEVCGQECERTISGGSVRGGDTPIFGGPIRTEDPGWVKDWDDVWRGDE